MQKAQQLLAALSLYIGINPILLLVGGVPDFLRILEDGAVGGELARVRDVEQALLAELFSVRVVRVRLDLRVNIERQIIEQEVVVGYLPGGTDQQSIVELLEAALALCAVVVEGAVDEGVMCRGLRHR